MASERVGWRAFAVSTPFLAALLACGASLGCSRTEAAPQEERYAHRYQPYEAEWRRESEIPREPPKFPGKVIWEVSRYAPGTPPTPEQQRAADDLVERCYEAARRHGWDDIEKGLADGFQRPLKDRLHYRNKEFMLDERVLDPDRPETLMYYPTPSGKRGLAGFMFYARTRTAPGPQIAGPLTVWHYHIWSKKQCVVRGMIAVDWAVEGVCKEGVGTHRSGEMMHVWLIDHPKGPFATSMTLGNTLVVEGLKKRMRERGF